MNIKKPTRYYSNKQETDIAKKIKGNKAVNSGAGKFSKGDVLSDRWLLECKTCIQEKKSFNIKKGWLEKLKEEQYSMNKQYSSLVFNFGDTKNYYILDEKTYLYLYELEKEINND